MHENTAWHEYTVLMPADHEVLFHLVKHPDRARENDFRSRHQRDRPRAWPDEDAADYFAISCYDDLDYAKANAVDTDWRGVARFRVDGHAGFVYAQTYEPHHYSVWGDSAVLRDAVIDVQAV